MIEIAGRLRPLCQGERDRLAEWRTEQHVNLLLAQPPVHPVEHRLCPSANTVVPRSPPRRSGGGFGGDRPQAAPAGPEQAP